MTVQVIDNGDNAVTITRDATDARSAMLASAATIAAFVVETEGKLGETAKAWGQSLFRAVYVDKAASLDALIGDSKVAAGWNILTSSDAGRKAKARLEVYFSNARLVAERWDANADKQADVLAGLSSIHYLAGQYRKADADAKKAASKAAALAKAEQDAADAKAAAGDSASDVATPEAPAAPDFFALLAAARALIDPATWSAAHVDAINALCADADACSQMVEDASATVEPVALAA